MKNLGYEKIIMDSALKAVGFYEKIKYNKTSEVFYGDNSPYVKRFLFFFYSNFGHVFGFICIK